MQDKQLRSHPKKNVESEILREHIKKEREATKTGKRPYYLKKCWFLNPISSPPPPPHYVFTYSAIVLMLTSIFLDQLKFVKGS